MGTYRGIFGNMGTPVTLPDPPIAAAQPPKHDALKRIAGIFADFAAGLNGRPGPYLAMQQHRQDLAEQEAQYQRRLADQFAMFTKQQDYKLAHPAPSDDAFTRALQMAGVDPASEQGRTLALQRAQALAADPNDAFVATTLPGNRFYAGPKSGLAAALGSMTGGGAPDSTPTVEDGYQYTPGPGGRANQSNWKPAGGATTSGMPPFGVSGDRLDQITMLAESGGNPNAVSSAGARGLMQVMPATARDPGFGIRPSNGTPQDDVRVGKEYRRAMLNRYGNVGQMWAAYNAGPGTMDAARQYGADWLSHLPRETQNYVTRNLRALRGN